MSWKIRHEGSPRSIECSSLQQVVEGLQDGLWEPTDEVMGPQDQQWTAIENHPQLAEIARDTKKTQLLVDHDNAVDWGSVVEVLDAAKGAGIQRANFLAKPKAQ